MVRHEAAEALGALSSESSLPLLKRYLWDESREVRETCELAIGKIEWDHSEEGKRRIPKYVYVVLMSRVQCLISKQELVLSLTV